MNGVISPGVRQGCVLAANLFNIAIGRILINNTTQALPLGVTYDDTGQLITDMDYTDDIVIFADLLDSLKDARIIFNEQSQNWVYMSTGPRQNFSHSAHGYPLHHQHSSEHNFSQRPTTSHTLAASSPVITAYGCAAHTVFVLTVAPQMFRRRGGSLSRAHSVGRPPCTPRQCVTTREFCSSGWMSYFFRLLWVASHLFCHFLIRASAGLHRRGWEVETKLLRECKQLFIGWW